MERPQRSADKQTCAQTMASISAPTGDRVGVGSKSLNHPTQLDERWRLATFLKIALMGAPPEAHHFFSLSDHFGGGETSD